MPGRWTRCAAHRARVDALARSSAPEPPVVDEEYIEIVAVYTAVLAAPPGAIFRACEMGARWGTWGARAAAFARALRPDLSMDLLFFEPDALFADGLEAVMAINGIARAPADGGLAAPDAAAPAQYTYRLERGFATAAAFNAWAARRNGGRVDLVNMDIQKGEDDLIPELRDVLASSVLRLVVGTHSPEIHARVVAHFEQPSPARWQLLRAMPYTSNEGCLAHTLYTALEKRASGNLAAAAAMPGCTHLVQDVGLVAQWDGELILDNAALAATAMRSAKACLHFSPSGL
jgi:hypothetical protein